MKHIYTAAYKLIGATRPACDAEVVVGNFPDLHGKMSVVYEIDDHLFEIDRAAAAGTSMLKALVGQAGEVSMEDRIANEIANIREVRQSASAFQTYFFSTEQKEKLTFGTPVPQMNLKSLSWLSMALISPLSSVTIKRQSRALLPHSLWGHSTSVDLPKSLRACTLSMAQESLIIPLALAVRAKLLYQQR